jgi:hypothetical protein
MVCDSVDVFTVLLKGSLFHLDVFTELLKGILVGGSLEALGSCHSPSVA